MKTNVKNMNTNYKREFLSPHFVAIVICWVIIVGSIVLSASTKKREIIETIPAIPAYVQVECFVGMSCDKSRIRANAYMLSMIKKGYTIKSVNVDHGTVCVIVELYNR